MKQFIEAGLGIEAAKTKLLEYQKLSIATGDSIESLAQSFRKVKAGGLDAGEGAAKFLKTPLMLGLVTEEKNRGLVEKRAKAHDKEQIDAVYHGAASPQVAKDKEAVAAIDAQLKETTADWVKAGNLTSKVLDSILSRVTGPGGQYEHAVDLQGETQSQKKKDAAEAFDDDLIQLGKAMSTGLKPALDDLTAQLPKLEGYFTALGTAATSAIQVLETMGGMAKQGVGAVEGWSSDAAKAEYDRKHGHVGAYDDAVNNPNTHLPKPGDKVQSLETLEAHAAATNEKLEKVLNTLSAWSAS